MPRYAELTRVPGGRDLALEPASPTPQGGIVQLRIIAQAGEDETAMSLLPPGWYLMDVMTTTYGVNNHVWRADVVVEVVSGDS